MPTRCLSRWIRHCRYNEVDCGTETSRTKSYFYMYVGSTRTPDEVGLCALGVEVNGIRRKNSRILEPSGDIRFEADDVAVLLGTLTALASAEDCLINGPDNDSPESLLESA